MFEDWGFLLTEIWVLLALAALVGLVAGWIIWGRGAREDAGVGGELDRARTALAECEAKGRAADGRISALEDELVAAKAVPVPVPVPVPVKVVAEAVPVVEPVKVVAKPAVEVKPQDKDKPAALDKPRDGKPDDLKLINGIGPKLEKLCNRLGFWHFDQIAVWKAAEIAWVDENLEGFKGRVTRDEWVKQAKALAKKKG